MKKIFLSSFLVTASAVVSLPAAADIITFAGSSVIDRAVFSASATFEINGDNLMIVLRNTSPSTTRPDTPARTLSGLFWEFLNDEGVTLTPVSATLAPGQSIMGTCSVRDCAGENNVGGEFGYRAVELQGGSDRFISSVSYQIPNFRANFNGDNLHGQPALGGIDFSIVSSAEGYAPNTGLAAVPVIMGEVKFTLSGATRLTLDDIRNVSFQPGTTLQANYVPASVVPEPASIALLGFGLASLAAARCSRRRKDTAI